MGDHPLRPPTRRRLGRPLPYQLADGPQAPPKAPRLRAAFRRGSLTPRRVRGISSPFGLLSPSSGQVAYVLLTHSPLGLPSYCYKGNLVRLACIRHAASVHPEPGSNSPLGLSNVRRRFRVRRLTGHKRSRFPVTIQLLRCGSPNRVMLTPRPWAVKETDAETPMPFCAHRPGADRTGQLLTYSVRGGPGSLTPLSSSLDWVFPPGG